MGCYLSIPSRIQVKLFILVVWFYLSLMCVFRSFLGWSLFSRCFGWFCFAGPSLDRLSLYRPPEKGKRPRHPAKTLKLPPQWSPSPKTRNHPVHHRLSGAALGGRRHPTGGGGRTGGTHRQKAHSPAHRAGAWSWSRQSSRHSWNGSRWGRLRRGPWTSQPQPPHHLQK